MWLIRLFRSLFGRKETWAYDHPDGTTFVMNGKPIDLYSNGKIIPKRKL